MQKHEFEIGQTFWCAEKHWRCTDIGNRVIAAICLGPTEIVKSKQDDTGAWQQSSRFVSEDDDPTLFAGPPYAVNEVVFDEYDQEGCVLTKEEL